MRYSTQLVIPLYVYVQIRPLHVKNMHILPLWGSNASQNEHIDNSTGSEDVLPFHHLERRTG